MKKKFKTGEDITQELLDWLGGRTENQEQWLKECRAIRDYIIKNPGVTSKTLKVKAGATAKHIQWLLNKRFIQYCGPLGFEVRPI